MTTAKDLDWVPLYIQRLIASDAWRLPDFQFGWYMKLLVSAADRGGYLPGSVSELWQIAGAKSDAYFVKWGGSELVSRYFRRTDDDTNRIYNPRMLEVIGKQSKKLKKSRDSLSLSTGVDVGFVLPSWIPREAWDEYEIMRKKIRKPMTDKARTLAIAELENLRNAGHDPEMVLNQSVLNSWQGLFPLRDRPKSLESATGARSVRRCCYCDREYKQVESTAPKHPDQCCSEKCENEVREYRKGLLKQ